MTSIATSFQAPLTPPQTKKRVFSEVDTLVRQPLPKRLHSLNLPPRPFGPFHKPSVLIPKAVTQASPSTGVENHLKLDVDFVAASKSTEEDEAKRTVQVSSDSSYIALLADRRHLSSKILSSWQEDILGPGRGLKNLTGALCYRHALFQALLHTPKFVYWVTTHHKDEDCVSDAPGTCVSCHMRLLIKSYWSSNGKRGEVVRHLDRIHDLFRELGWRTHSANGHGDPDEQFAWMLDIMRAEMPTSVFSYFDAFHNSLLESEIKCGRCGHVSKTRGNNERQLSIPIKVPSVTSHHLQHYIYAYMNESIQGYRCENEKCKHVSDIHRIQKVAYAPDVLLVQLKRFNYRGQKDSSRVHYGQRLDLSHHTANPSLGPLLYDLTAVISHSGTSSFGHYHCVAKTPERTWCEFDDLTVRDVDVKCALNPAAIDPDWTPYLLFYERNKASMPPA